MQNVKKVLENIEKFNNTTKLNKVMPGGDIIYEPLINSKSKKSSGTRNYGYMIFSKEEYEPALDKLKQCQRKHRYYYYEQLAKDNAKNVIFVMFNPSTACPNCDDPTIRNCRTLVENTYGSMEIINIYSQRNPNVKEIVKDDNEENLNFIKAFLGNRRGSDIVVAWGYGKKKEYKAQVEAVEKLLEDFNKYKIIVKEEVIREIQNLDRHPAPTSWTVFKGFEHSAKLAKY